MLKRLRPFLYIVAIVGLILFSCKKKDQTSKDPIVYKFQARSVTYFTGWLQNLYCTFRNKADTTDADTAQLTTFNKISYKLPNISNPDQYREDVNFEYQDAGHYFDLKGEIYSYQGVDNFIFNAYVDNTTFTNSFVLDTTNTVIGGTDSTTIDMLINNYIIGTDTFGTVRRIEFKNLNGVNQASVNVPVNFAMYFKSRLGLIGYDIQIAGFPKRRYYLYSSHL